MTGGLEGEVTLHVGVWREEDHPLHLASGHVGGAVDHPGAHVRDPAAAYLSLPPMTGPAPGLMPLLLLFLPSASDLHHTLMRLLYFLCSCMV